MKIELVGKTEFFPPDVPWETDAGVCIFKIVNHQTWSHVE